MNKDAAMSEDKITFSELDRLMDLDPLDLSSQDIDKIIAAQRSYRANATQGRGRATKFSDEANVTIDLKALGLIQPKEEIKRRI